MGIWSVVHLCTARCAFVLTYDWPDFMYVPSSSFPFSLFSLLLTTVPSSSSLPLSNPLHSSLTSGERRGEGCSNHFLGSGGEALYSVWTRDQSCTLLSRTLSGLPPLRPRPLYEHPDPILWTCRTVVSLIFLPSLPWFSFRLVLGLRGPERGLWP